MEQFETWRQAITASLQQLFNTVISYLPNFLAALVVLIIGVLVAATLGKLIEKIITFTRVDYAIDRLGVNRVFSGFGKIKISGIIGWIVKWFLIVVVLMAVADILKLPQIIEFLKDVARFLPNVAVAVAILLIGFIGGNFVYEIVFRSVRTAKIHSSKVLANLAKWSIIVFALMASLLQLGIAKELVSILFTGLIAMLALAGGLAFGLGGKDKAAHWLEDLRKKL
ncbi:hypothetical protein HYW82_00520 [Candidatus Peregrinibacteria bacterium]|nr:hypothetical protein [Candidatus Peregrinibacteria bacterium]